jgi:hypothetical protein
VTMTGHFSETTSRYRSRIPIARPRLSAAVIEGSRAEPSCAAERSARGAARRRRPW